MKNLIKTAIKKLPGISRLVDQRQALSLDLVETRHQRDQFFTKLEATENELEDIQLKFGETGMIVEETRLQLEQSQANLETLEAEHRDLKYRQGFVPPGHFYSPIPDIEDIKNNQNRVFTEDSQFVPGVDLDERSQLELLNRFIAYYGELPFKPKRQEGLRYYYENTAFSYSDAIFLHCMIRDIKPKRIIEVGSGFSSCMTLDTNELFFDNSIETTFIEPYPALLHELLKPTDLERIKVVPSRLQDVDLVEFDALQANDILFIDSTHVSKIDSDVNRIIFDILPRLASGVYVHFHDIFFPFEYPKEWVLEGRAWNEAYLLKAFLQFNQSFEIVLMNSYLANHQRSFLEEHFPLCLKHTGSIWIRKK